MILTSDTFQHMGQMPAGCAFGLFLNCKLVLQSNRNPDLQWDGCPPLTKSFALLLDDIDVPDGINASSQSDFHSPADGKRHSLCHWILIDIPSSIQRIREGEYSDAAVPKGKPGPLAAHGTRQGLNDYTQWFSSHPSMRGNYFGYDGPCPPPKDHLVHRYRFTIYALRVDRLPIDGLFNREDIKLAMSEYIIDEASLIGLFTSNSNARDIRS